MDIYLSINNREKVIQMPVLPSEINIKSAQGNEIYQTVTGELNLIGNMELKSISWNSFFPERVSMFKRSRSDKLGAWEIVEEIEKMRGRKLPLRLVITETPINIAVTVDNFEYGLRAGPGHIWYTIELKEFVL